MDDQADQPTIERRIRAAMSLAGIDFIELAERIATPNYGERTLRNMVNEAFEDRVASRGDLVLIARACGVSEAFWHVDFAALDEPTLRVDVSRLRADLEDLSRTVLRQSAELRALRDQRRGKEPPADDPR